MALCATVLCTTGVAATGLPDATASTRAKHLTGAASPNGPAVKLAFDAGGETGTLSFMGVAGESVTVTTDRGTFPSACAVQLEVIAPDASTVAGPACAGVKTSVGPLPLTLNGTYQMKLVAGPSATGKLRVVVTSSGPTMSITPDAAPIQITINEPHQLVKLGFFGHAGDEFSAVSDNGNITPSCRVGLSITDSTGESVGGSTCEGAPSTGFADTATLPADGVYYLEALEHNGDPTPGSFHARLLSVADIEGPIAADGTPKTLTIRTPGQNAEYHFTGTIGQRVSVLLSDYAITGECTVALVRPNTTYLVASTCDTGGGFIDATALDANGVWTVRVDPTGPAVGTTTVRASTVIDGQHPITAGHTKRLTVTLPGENPSLRFPGTVGDHRTITVSNVSLPNESTYIVWLIRPDGTALDGIESPLPEGTLDDTLDATGTWSIVLDPQWGQTGTARFKLQ